MRIFKIKKRSGAFRTIYSPSAEEGSALKKLLPSLINLAIRANQYGVQHGFHPDRSSVTNAMQHRGWRYTISFDLADFFDSVTAKKVIDAASAFGIIPLDAFNRCFPDGSARQGLCTSPALANIAAAPMDKEILEFVSNVIQPNRIFGGIRDIKRDCSYTRYADDMTFSFDSVQWFERLKTEIPLIASKHGFVINKAKTHMQAAAAGRRMITGVAVDDKLHIPRATRRRLRAAIHQQNTDQSRGLAEWCKLKTPKGYRHIPKPEKANQSKGTKTLQKTTPTNGKSKTVPLPKRIIQLSDET